MIYPSGCSWTSASWAGFVAGCCLQEFGNFCGSGAASGKVSGATAAAASSLSEGSLWGLFGLNPGCSSPCQLGSCGTGGTGCSLGRQPELGSFCSGSWPALCKDCLISFGSLPWHRLKAVAGTGIRFLLAYQESLLSCSCCCRCFAERLAGRRLAIRRGSVAAEVGCY